MKKIIIAVALCAVVLFGYYVISPLFRNIKADEALPVEVTSAISTSSPVVVSTEGEQKNEAINRDSSPALVVGTLGHPASGTARIVTSERKTYVRYENFKTINGPDIFVYLSKDLEAKEYINLGAVRATEGNINYEIPTTVNVAEYPYVLTWCKQFGVLFNSAKLQ